MSFKIPRDDVYAQPGLKLLILKEPDSWRTPLPCSQNSQPLEAGVRMPEFQSQLSPPPHNHLPLTLSQCLNFPGGQFTQRENEDDISPTP